MENLELLEKSAIKNLKIALDEKKIAIESKNMAKAELKKAKAREQLSKKGLELAKIRKELAEQTTNLIKSKIASKDLFEYSDLGLNIEKKYALFNENLAHIQIEIAENHRKIAKVETDISEANKSLMDEKIHVAKEREKLGKLQLAYVKLVKAAASEEKKARAKEKFGSQQNDLKKSENRINEKMEIVRKKQNTLSDLKKKLTLKLSEREKIRP
ncbi:MAG: hypothetical protein ACFFBH_03980 [Promethearchaeota archaeon]